MQKFIKPACPSQIGEVQLLDRTLAAELTYRHALKDNNKWTIARAAPDWSISPLNANSSHSADARRPAARHQPDGRVSTVEITSNSL